MKEIPRNVVLIGDKPIRLYGITITHMINNNEKDIFIRSRGRMNSKALDVTQYIVNKLWKGKCQVEDIQINSQVFDDNPDKYITCLQIKLRVF